VKGQGHERKFFRRTSSCVNTISGNRRSGEREREIKHEYKKNNVNYILEGQCFENGNKENSLQCKMTMADTQRDKAKRRKQTTADKRKKEVST
jgi:hypothetical protein